MGTIVPRRRRDGSTAYTAQIRIRRGGEIVHNETQTFERKAAATAWLRKREAELHAPGGLEKAKVADPTLAEVVDRYLETSQREIGRTKAQVLRSVKALPIGAMTCSAITAQDWTTMAEGIDAKPQTRQNYLSHLASVAAVAKPLWGYNLDPAVLREASVALRRHGVIGKSAKRERRPSVAELDVVMAHFAERQVRTPHATPMCRIVAFALFSARRQDEILRIRWADLDVTHSRVLVRDMKHPGQKVGNDVWCDLPPEALRVILAMPRDEDRIFPFGNDGVSAAFTRAMPLLGIVDLHFHDLRHEGVSRLFEMGRTIPQVAAVSGHRSWISLQRYAHLRQTGDKWAGWAWLDQIAPAAG